MTNKINRRNFLKKSAIASAAALGFSFEEKALLAKDTAKTPVKPPKNSLKAIPKGKIRNLDISRVICGGNLIGGWAHSRDLIYVSELVKSYHTDEKVFETLALAEENGINAIITNPSADRVLNRYWNERGGKIQWISEGHPSPKDIKTGIQKSIDKGASSVYIQGGVADNWVKKGLIDELGQALEFIKSNGIPGGIGGHSISVPIACEKAGFNPDYYVKTLHSSNYWSARKPDQPIDVIENTKDNFWCSDAEETIEFMKNLDKPWIAYKVLAAGAIHPREGFKYAFDNGADFICVGMFDFQVLEDVVIARTTLANLDRQRPWRA